VSMERGSAGGGSSGGGSSGGGCFAAATAAVSRRAGGGMNSTSEESSVSEAEEDDESSVTEAEEDDDQCSGTRPRERQSWHVAAGPQEVQRSRGGVGMGGARRARGVWARHRGHSTCPVSHRAPHEQSGAPERSGRVEAMDTAEKVHAGSGRRASGKGQRRLPTRPAEPMSQQTVSERSWAFQGETTVPCQLTGGAELSSRGRNATESREPTDACNKGASMSAGDSASSSLSPSSAERERPATSGQVQPLVSSTRCKGPVSVSSSSSSSSSAGGSAVKATSTTEARVAPSTASSEDRSSSTRVHWRERPEGATRQKA
jgi:hypothetical protein